MSDIIKKQKELKEKSDILIEKIEKEDSELKSIINSVDKQNELINKNIKISKNNMQKIIDETKRVEDVARNCSQILDDLDRQFEEKTGLTSTDVVFLFMAVGLQVLRWNIVSNDKFRITSTQGDALMEKGVSSIVPKWQDILIQSVPYDALQKSDFSTVQDLGLSGTTHRYRTLGHDPFLGWIFGTANILTSSLTTTDFLTYSINNMHIIRQYPAGTVGMFEKAVNYSINDPKLLAAAVARQAIHFGSDYFTKQGLPLPLIATVDNDTAKKMLTNWNIDMWSVTRGAVLASFINQLISIIHGLFYTGNSETERKLYEVRTRKILMYSNVISSSSNVVAVAITKNMKKLDIGGLAVSIYRLIKDKKFIRQVKEEFIFDSFDKMIQGDELVFDEVYLY